MNGIPLRRPARFDLSPGAFVLTLGPSPRSTPGCRTSHFSTRQLRVVSPLGQWNRAQRPGVLIVWHLIRRNRTPRRECPTPGFAQTQRVRDTSSENTRQLGRCREGYSGLVSVRRGIFQRPLTAKSPLAFGALCCRAPIGQGRRFREVTTPKGIRSSAHHLCRRHRRSTVAFRFQIA